MHHAKIRLEPAKRVALSQVVFDQLLGRIKDGSLRSGDRLPSENELRRMLRVGRSSVREALRSLITMGLIDTKPGRGAIVTVRHRNPLAYLDVAGRSVEHVQKWALLDLLEVRECLEGQAAVLAAARATPQDLIAIEGFAREMERQIADGRTYFRSNAAYHSAIARASHNSILSESVRRLIGQVRAFRERLMREVQDMPERDVAEHREILEAIQLHEPEHAQHAMIRHHCCPN
jgi:GntR family transcriptional repressor for pyruvate dehydrogenase complex